MYGSCMKRSAKATKTIAETLDGQYVGIRLYIDFLFNEFCAKEIAEL